MDRALGGVVEQEVGYACLCHSCGSDELGTFAQGCVAVQQKCLALIVARPEVPASERCVVGEDVHTTASKRTGDNVRVAGMDVRLGVEASYLAEDLHIVEVESRL